MQLVVARALFLNFETPFPKIGRPLNERSIGSGGRRGGAFQKRCYLQRWERRHAACTVASYPCCHCADARIIARAILMWLPCCCLLAVVVHSCSLLNLVLEIAIVIMCVVDPSYRCRCGRTLL
jgi:hypothetical protein